MKSFDIDDYAFPHTKQIVESSEEDNIDTLLCFSTFRWGDVFQRPQHLMSHASKKWRVFYIEEPTFDEAGNTPQMEVKELNKNKQLYVVRICLPKDMPDITKTMRGLLAQLCYEQEIKNFGIWYYTIEAIHYTSELYPRVVVYDCTKPISPENRSLVNLENELISQCDLVFTNGQLLYDAKKNWHPHVYDFRSSIDKEHFMQARLELPEPRDQDNVLYPRIGCYGAIDECFDLALFGALASHRPDWQFVLIGPVVGIDKATLPVAENIHYLGEKRYQSLPSYMSGWDAALLLVSAEKAALAHVPTRVAEYLAAFTPIVATPVAEVIHPYDEMGLLSVAQDAVEFERAIEEVLSDDQRRHWKQTIDEYLKMHSWDTTWQQMRHLIKTHILA